MVSEKIFLKASIVKEMTDLPQFPDNPNYDVKKIIKDLGDKDPLFVIIRIEEGLSNNVRYWPGDIIESIINQVLEKEPIANPGHIKDEDRGDILPEPLTVWYTGITTIEDDKTVGYIKGYVLPTADKLKVWLKTKAVDSVSIYGTADMEFVEDDYTSYWRVIFFNLESIDWARKGAEGMNAKVVAITKEMKGEESMDVKTIEIIKGITVGEITQHNPKLIEAIKTNITPEIKEQVIKEMKESEEYKKTQNVVSEMSKVREVLGIKEDENVVEVVKEMKTLTDDTKKIIDDHRKSKLESIENEVIREMIEKSLKGNTIKEIDENFEKLTAAIGEMTGKDYKLSPKNNNKGKTTSKYFIDDEE